MTREPVVPDAHHEKRWHNIQQSIEQIPIDRLKPPHRKTRTHSDAQIRKIARSMERFGFVPPVIVDGEWRVIDGWAAVQAAQSIGRTHVPVVQVHHLSAAEARALRLALNKLPEATHWDDVVLKLEFNEIMALDDEFDLTFTGFEMGEIDLVLGEEDPAPESPVPPLDRDQPATARLGDRFELGDHRLACVDARNTQVYSEMLKGAPCPLTLTDPPYNVPIEGHVSGKGQHHHADFAMASGEMSDDEFRAFLSTVLTLINQFAPNGALHFIFMDWRHIELLLSVGRSVFSSLANLCIWTKTNAGMGSLYRSQHELVALFKTGSAPHVNNVQLGRYGRHRSNVWSYPGVTSFGEGRDEALAMHPTVKPLALIRDAILDVTHRGERVLDPFVGSGTTLIACEDVGRRCAALEIDPYYVDAAIRRWQLHTGETARLAGTQTTFDDLDAQRQGKPEVDPE